MRAKAIDINSFYEKDIPSDAGSVYFLPIPMETYLALETEAKKRNMSFLQLLGKSIDLYLKSSI